MPEDNNESQAPIQDAAEDRVKNLQAEMTRKTNNLDEKLNQINESLRQMSMLNNPVQQPRSQVIEERPDPILQPQEFETYMERKMESKMNARLDTQQRQQSEISMLANQFPELSDSNNELTRNAIQNYNNMSALEKNSPGSYKLAVQSAALDLGILPANRRKQTKVADESDDIGNRSNANNKQGAPKGKAKLDSATIEFARALGKDINDPKYMERLQKAGSRQTWGKSKNRSEY